MDASRLKARVSSTGWFAAVAAFVGLSALLVGCSGTPATTTDVSADAASRVTSEATLASPEQGVPEPVVVESDVPYYMTPDGSPMLLDVYTPSGTAATEGASIVIVFHRNPVFGGSKRSVSDLASKIAGTGAVAVAPTYGSSSFDPAEVLRWFRDEGSCAVWRAVEIGRELGADVGSLTLVGDATGILPAQMVIFDAPAQIDGCLAPPATPDIGRAVLFETDWLFIPPFWDEVFEDNPGYFAAITHWDDIYPVRSTEVRVLAGEQPSFDTVRPMNGEAYEDAAWVQLRDPGSQFTTVFDRLGVLSDDEMSFTDVAMVTVEVLSEAGWDAEFILVPGVGHSLNTDDAREFVARLAVSD